MELRTLLEDDQAVSPVIGVILMVAITVILAAVIGTFVLGLGDQVSNTSPQASFTFDYNEGGDAACGGTQGDGALTVTHDGGDPIAANQLNTSGSNVTDANVAWDATCTGLATGDDVTAGTSESFAAENADTIRIVWTASGGGDSSTIGKWTGPDA